MICSNCEKRQPKRGEPLCGVCKYHDLKEKVFSLYGSKCNICGFKNLLALQIDHINGIGREERRHMSSSKFMEKILSSSKDYQLLCANCNIIKYRKQHPISPLQRSDREIIRTLVKRLIS